MKACTLLFHQTCVSNFTVREGFTGVFVKGRGLTGLPPKRTVDGGQTFTRTYIYIYFIIFLEENGWGLSWGQFKKNRRPIKNHSMH